jgi:hypothetical protein
MSGIFTWKDSRACCIPTAAVPASKEGFYELSHGLRRFAVGRVDDDDGVLLPSLVLPASLQHLLLFPASYLRV